MDCSENQRLRLDYESPTVTNLQCPELERLRRGYESAVRRWGNVLLQAAGLISGPAFTETDLVETYRERDEAKARILAHADCCLLCGPSLPARLM
jgi:hypothetical protein